MKLNLNFFGAARNVTGSCYLLDTGTARILVDCGYYQERDLVKRNWVPFEFDAATVNAVLLTHAHLDHCGLLPKLVKEGFEGAIYGTPATLDIAEIIMRDSAKIQKEDIKHKKKRHKRQGRTSPHPLVPIYTEEDVEDTLRRFSPVDYEKECSPVDGITAVFRDAGHILGSSMIQVRVKQGDEERVLAFSGDMGQWGAPIIDDPTLIDEADYIVVESTYGDRTHKPNEGIPDALAKVINETQKAGGNIVIPSFAVERTQELIYHLNGLLKDDRIPNLPVFIDSPMAVRVTEVFRRHPELFDDEAMALLNSGNHPCDFAGLQLSRSVDESKAIKQVHGTAIIIAGSGMCTGGRIKHHLANNIEREDSTILFVGYQANGTLGRIILEGAPRVRIKGEQRSVLARVERINGFSAHADRDELFRWLKGFKSTPRQVFVTHGESKSADHFAAWVHEQTGWKVSVAEYMKGVDLD